MSFNIALRIPTDFTDSFFTRKSLSSLGMQTKFSGIHTEKSGPFDKLSHSFPPMSVRKIVVYSDNLSIQLCQVKHLTEQRLGESQIPITSHCICRMGHSKTELPVNRYTHRHAPWLACNIEQNPR